MSVWREIQPQYSNPEAYTVEESYYGNGNYPPDWERRKKAIWQQQSDTCGRCGRERDEVHRVNVHHIQPLSEGGSNELDNLVGLCCDCHALRHPYSDKIEGYYAESPVYPAKDAVREVATVRSKRIEDAESVSSLVKNDLSTLEQYSSPEANQPSITEYTYSIEEDHARKLPEKLTTLLRQYGEYPESSEYYTIDISIKLQTIRGILFDYTPELEVSTDGEIRRRSDWQGRWRKLSLCLEISENANELVLVLSDGTGTSEHMIQLNQQFIRVNFTARPSSLLDGN
jgi:5-methylcytosine-specific restriction endonuclease McrA